MLASAVALIGAGDAAWWQTVAFVLWPDHAVLYGIAPGLARGQLHPRAVPLYTSSGGRSLALVALAAGLPLGSVAGAIAWGLHVAVDRATGLRPRSPDGFQRAESW